MIGHSGDEPAAEPEEPNHDDPRRPPPRVLGALAAGPATAQQGAEIKMTGQCERLVIGDKDITQNCKG